MLAALAERTRTLRLGIAIVLLPLSHPLRVAEEVATLDVLSNGRVEFGIGRGSIPTHFTGFGVAQTESRDRFLESLDLILQAWTQDRVSFRGRFFQMDNISVVPKPVQRPYPPIRVAANSADTFELMGQIGYPIFVASQVNPFRKIREFLPLYHQAREAAGHPTSTAEDVTVLMPLYVGNDSGEVRGVMEPSVRHWLHTASMLYSSSHIGSGPEAVRLKELSERARRMTYEQVCEVMAVFATPDACVEHLKRFQQEFGMGRVICWFNPGGMVPYQQVMQSMELFATKVMPHFAK
jgi:alkanesulfonate monooxygenase SsuD/methylene tetrahydromethanopterin reductase-like flavin-dependent oxidoreductase (luciferase family)